MPVVKNLMVRAGADFSPIAKQAQRAQKSMQTMQQRVNSSCRLMQSAMNGLKRVMGALGVSLSIGAIVSASKAAKEAYDVQAAAEARLAQVMRNTMGARASDIKSIKDLTSAQQELGVVGDEVQLSGAQELATYLSQRESLEKLIPVMNDMIAQQYGYNATTESAVNIATMMGKVMDGQTGALRRYGYTFTEAQEAVLQYGNEADRAATLAEVVSASVGGMNQALASTPTGRIQQLKNTLGDIKERFGQAVTSILTTFLPVLQAVARVLADVATLANRVAQAIANVFGSGGTAQSAIIGYGGAAAGAVGEISDATEDAAQSAEKMATAGFDTLQKLSGGSTGGAASGDDSGGGGITTIVEDADEAGETVGWLERGLQRIKDLVDGWDTSKLSAAFERFKEAAEPIVGAIGEGLAWLFENVLVPLGKWTIEEAAPAALEALSDGLEFLRTVCEKLQPAWDWVWENILKPTAHALGEGVIQDLHTIGNAFGDLTDLLTGDISWGDCFYVDENGLAFKIHLWWQDTKESIKTKWEWLTSGIETKWAKIRAWWGNTKEGIRQRWQSLTSGISTKWATIRAWWGNTREGIRQRWQSLTSGIETKWATIRAWWANTKEGIKQKWRDLTSGIGEFTAPIRAKIKSTWKELKGSLDAILAPAAKYVIHIAADIAVTLNDIKTWINTAIIDPINRALRDVEIFGARPFWNVQIPHLAEGGYLRANNPTFAVVGDNRSQGEIVSPEGKLAAMAQEAARRAILGARMVMAGAMNIRAPMDVPTALRALTGPYGAATLSVGGIGDEAMTILRRLLGAVEDGKILTVDRQAFGQLVRQANSAYARTSGSVPVAR